MIIQTKLKEISKLKIKYPLIGLSPMDGVTDAAYREIVKKYGGVDLMYTEFVNVHGLSLGIDRLFSELRFSEFQRPILSQIYGHEVEYFYPASIICLCLGFDGVDINMGCPAKKISDRGAGAGLIRTPDTAKEIVYEVKRARDEYISFWKGKEYSIDTLREFLEKNGLGKLTNKIDNYLTTWEIDTKYITSEDRLNNLTVSLKTRIGYDSDISEKWISHLSTTKPDFLALHGRTLKQMYTGTASWDAIARAVSSTDIPLFANGDIKSLDDAKKCLEQTKSFGLLLGRATYGSPTIIKEIKDYLETNIKADKNDFELTKKIIIDHCEFFLKYKGVGRFFEMRKNLAWYIQGFPNAKNLRKELVVCNNLDDVKQVLENVTIME